MTGTYCDGLHVHGLISQMGFSPTLGERNSMPGFTFRPSTLKSVLSEEIPDGKRPFREEFRFVHGFISQMGFSPTLGGRNRCSDSLFLLHPEESGSGKSA